METPFRLLLNERQADLIGGESEVGVPRLETGDATDSNGKEGNSKIGHLSKKGQDRPNWPEIPIPMEKTHPETLR